MAKMPIEAAMPTMLIDGRAVIEREGDLFAIWLPSGRAHVRVVMTLHNLALLAHASGDAIRTAHHANSASAVVLAFPDKKRKAARR